jgi:hypothetical protein
METHGAQLRQQTDERCSGPHDLRASCRRLASSTAGSLCPVLAAWIHTQTGEMTLRIVRRRREGEICGAEVIDEIEAVG